MRSGKASGLIVELSRMKKRQPLNLEATVEIIEEESRQLIFPFLESRFDQLVILRTEKGYALQMRNKGQFGAEINFASTQFQFNEFYVSATTGPIFMVYGDRYIELKGNYEVRIFV